MPDRNYNPTAYVFRVIREQIDGQTVRVLLEPYMGIQHLEIHEGDEFIIAPDIAAALGVDHDDPR